ncbi:unannotated protein [freshwater metagenome]|uniref:Unannotated protein n=1 Tax=freshwater metagenome TaxID=449393 RepID=A0A6J6QDH3_9ZZZZ
MPLGSTIAVAGVLAPADDGDLSALLRVGGEPMVRAPPDVWWRASGEVRESLRDAVADRPPDQRALVPALVNGDDAGLDPGLADDFRTTGLTHLLAVSGTNLTLVVGFLLVLARAVGVRGRWLLPVALVGIVGFVLIARTEPSVLRAAVMGGVGLLALGANGTQRGMRTLGVAVVLLLMVQPTLAVSAGFTLSVLATAGILVLVPIWRDALARWLPSWLAEAVAVPMAAQLACTPVVAALSGQVSLVAVLANLLVGPVVGPATVLGLGGGLVGLVWPLGGRLLGTAASWCVAWIIAVAEHGADLPLAAASWSAGAGGLVLLTVACIGVAVAGPRVVARPILGVGCCLMLVVVVVVRAPSPGWPPAGWLLVACDVGQGDGLVVHTGDGQAMVVDTGSDPRLMDDCLDDLGIRSVPVVVLTHFHADHVGGLAGVLDGRQVGAIVTSPLLDPPEAVGVVRGLAAARDIPIQAVGAGSAWTLGDVEVSALWPQETTVSSGPGDGSTANDASVVLLVESAGVSMLLTGDVEPPGQVAIATAHPGLRVDVLKLPHHGSRYQDLPFLDSLGARLVLVSVGADNDYGHPAPDVVAALEGTGASVLRTDESGDLAVVLAQGDLASVAR